MTHQPGENEPGPLTPADQPDPATDEAGATRAVPQGVPDPVQRRPEWPVGQVEQALSDFAGATQHAVEEVNKRAGRDLLAAIAVALGLLGLAAVCLIWFPPGLAVIITIAIVGAQIEFGRVLQGCRDIRIVWAPLLVGSVILALGTYWVQSTQTWSAAYLTVAVIGLTVVAILVWRLFGPVQGYVTDVTATVLLLVYPCLLTVSLINLLAWPQGPILLAMFIVGIAATDTGGYAFGLLLGRHPFAPTISPKKSWEGVIGSFVVAIACVTLMVIVIIGDDQWWKGVVLAVVLVVTGIIGDLVESVIKRDLQIKDMSNLLPGHGGIMDRMDSYILAAFPAWLTMAWLFPNA